MPVEEKDFILRVIQKLAETIASALRYVLKLKEEKRYDVALAALGESYHELLGLDGRFVHLLDAEAIRRALPHPEQRGALAQLLEAEAELQLLSQDPARAQLLSEKAAAVRAELRAEWARSKFHSI